MRVCKHGHVCVHARERKRERVMLIGSIKYKLLPSVSQYHLKSGYSSSKIFAKLVLNSPPFQQHKKHKQKEGKTGQGKKTEEKETKDLI